MANQIRRDSFGSISGIVTEDSILAVEIGSQQPKTVSVISVSFRESSPGAEFNECAVAVFRGAVADFPHSTDFRAMEKNQDLEYLKFFNSFEGFTEAVYITGGKSEKISIILFAPYIDGALDSATFGTLNVFGALANEKPLFDVAK